jgi:hypothetical protein
MGRPATVGGGGGWWKIERLSVGPVSCVGNGSKSKEEELFEFIQRTSKN